jgi:hypothetical protein
MSPLKLKVLLIFLLILIVLPWTFVYAQSFIEGLNPQTAKDNLPQFIANIYKVGVGAVGTLAVLAIMWGGILWLTSGGNTGQVANAKSWISGALLGLVLALTSFLILQTINPQLTSFELTELANIAGTPESEELCCQINGCDLSTRQGLCILRVALPECPTQTTDVTSNPLYCYASGIGGVGALCSDNSDCDQTCIIKRCPTLIGKLICSGGTCQEDLGRITVQAAKQGACEIPIPNNCPQLNF